GVQSAGIGSNSPLMGGWQTGFYREGVPAPSPSNMPSADLEVITGNYFATFKAPLLRGRTFNERDTKDSPRVIIIDQAMVDQFFPGEDPIGKRLAVDAGNDEEGNVMSEIVGVVARMRFHAIDEMAPLPVIYCSMAQAQRTSLGLFVRSSMSAASLAKSIRDTVSSIDPSQPVYDARPMIDRVHETWGTQRLLSFLFSIFAGLALRQLRESPGFTVVAVLPLALGIGANTAIVSLIQGLFLRGLPFSEPDRLVRIYGESKERDLKQMPSSVPKFWHYRDGQTVFS